jgi:hypothetical protein
MKRTLIALGLCLLTTLPVSAEIVKGVLRIKGAEMS